VSYWLLKTEPEEFSYADLVKLGKDAWDGVTNPVAQRNMRAMQVGDECVIYHTGGHREAVGLAKVVRAGYPDPADANGKRVLVDVSPVRELDRKTSLVAIKADPLFVDSPLVRQGRLSVVPLTDAQFQRLTA
jgi:predicted RNA-binding protein with PUA-like domain